MKNVSFLVIISVTIQKGIIAIAKVIIIPKGFINSDSTISPLSNKTTARVEPQEGQGTPVTFLIIQNPKGVLFEYDKL